RSGQVRRAEGDTAGAAADWLRAASIFKDLPSMKSTTRVIEAGCHAGLSAIAGVPGSGGSLHEAKAEAERAMAAPRRGGGDGYRDADAILNEAALDPLRDREDFRLLMLDLAMPADPFAR